MLNDDRQQEEAAAPWLKHHSLLGKVTRVIYEAQRAFGFITAYDPNSRDLQELRYPNNRVADKVHFLLDDQFNEGDLVVFRWEVTPEGKAKGNDYPIRAVKGTVQWVEKIESLHQEILDDLAVDLETLELECIFSFAERVYIADKYVRKIQAEQIPIAESHVKRQHEERGRDLTEQEKILREQEDEYEQNLKGLQERIKELNLREAKIEAEIEKRVRECVEKKESEIEAEYAEKFDQLEKRKIELKQHQNELDKSQEELEDLGNLIYPEKEKLNHLREELEIREGEINEFRRSWRLTTRDSEPTDFGTFGGEKDLINKIQYYIKAKGFDFHRDLIVNFYTCLKTGAIVILAGLSGTGKSSLVRLFAEAIGAGENVELVPVKANWTDDADLRGFYHPEQKRYITTPFLDTIIKANDKPNELFFICLDEMNLSQVEYYFSDFLSVLEQGNELILFSERESCRNVPRIVPIGGNVFFCGTVNIDETVHPFSDKVADRAQIIQFDQLPSFKDLDDDETTVEHVKPVRLTFDCFENEFKKPSENYSRVPRADWFNNLNGILKDGGFHFGHRVKEQIQSYCAYALESRLFGENGENYIVDLQIVQKILPKIRGLKEEKVDRTLDELSQYFDGKYRQAHSKVELMKKMDRSINYWELFRHVG